MGKRRQGVYVPRDVWDWLMGCGNDFEPPAARRLPNGEYARYWWRAELRRRIDEALRPRKHARAESRGQR